MGNMSFLKTMACRSLMDTDEYGVFIDHLNGVEKHPAYEAGWIWLDGWRWLGMGWLGMACIQTDIQAYRHISSNYRYIYIYLPS